MILNILLYHARNLFQANMPDHMQCRRRVCSICWNRCGKKVDTIIEPGSKLEGGLIDHVDAGYKAEDLQYSVSNVLLHTF